VRAVGSTGLFLRGETRWGDNFFAEMQNQKDLKLFSTHISYSNDWARTIPPLAVLNIPASVYLVVLLTISSLESLWLLASSGPSDLAVPEAGPDSLALDPALLPNGPASCLLKGKEARAGCRGKGSGPRTSFRHISGPIRITPASRTPLCHWPSSKCPPGSAPSASPAYCTLGAFRGPSDELPDGRHIIVKALLRQDIQTMNGHKA